MREITGQMNDKLASAYGIKIIDVRFKRVDLPPENVEKVFDSMRAERAQEAAAIRATGDAEARNIRAQADKDYTIKLAEAQRYASTVHGAGDGDATRIYNEAFGKDPAFFDFFRSMQALREGLGSDTTTYVGSPTGDFFRFFGHDGEGAKPVGSAGTANPSVE
jgi:membrane protease subunit HflC